MLGCRQARRPGSSNGRELAKIIFLQPYSFLACQLNIKIESNDEYEYILILELAKRMI